MVFVVPFDNESLLADTSLSSDVVFMSLGVSVSFLFKGLRSEDEEEVRLGVVETSEDEEESSEGGLEMLLFLGFFLSSRSTLS